MELLGQQVGRCRVEALIGRGGMGDVYRGVDLVLGRQVALKVIAGPGRARQESRARFRREARMLARFQHPNVCQVFDLIERDESDILVMEYLEGATLRDAMRSSLPLDLVLDIAGQIAAVLAAAHGEHIVHRDLKPENVMLQADGRVKVLDFGLACLAEGAGQERTGAPSFASGVVDGADTEEVGEEVSDSERLTRAGTFTGTLRYMSPEQAWGHAVDEASDLYSFGLVLREMVTGEPSYLCSGGGEQLLNQVRMAALAPLELGDLELAALITRLTAAEPAARPSAAEAVAALARLRDRPRRLRARRWLAAAAVAVTALLVSTVLATYRLARPEPWLESGAAERAVLLPLVNATGDPRNSWLELGLQEMVVQTVSASLGGVLVGAGDAAQVAGNLGVRGGAELGDPEVTAVATAFGVDLVIGGEVREEQGEFTLVYGARRPGGSVHRGRVSAASLTALAACFVRELELRLDPTAAAVELEQAYSDDGLANLAYAMGVGALAGDGARRARPYFEVSLDRDPELEWARLQLSHCVEKLGDPNLAVELANRALQRSRARKLGDVEAASLQRLGTLARSRGDFTQADELLHAALALARTRGDRGRQAECLNELGRLALARFQLDRAASLLAEALAEAVAGGRRPLEARLLLNLGMLDWRRGDQAAARTQFEVALERARRLADRDLELACRTNLGMIALSDRKVDEAAAAFAAARDLARELGNREAELVAVANLGTVAVFRQAWGDAEARYREVLQARVALGDQPGQAKVLNNLGQVAMFQDRFDDATALWQEALAIRTALGDENGQALVFVSLGELGIRSRRLAEARRHLERALRMLEAGGDRRWQATAQVDLGEVALDEGRTGEARRRLAAARALQPDLAEALKLEAGLAFADGDEEGATRLLASARAALGPSWSARDESEILRHRRTAPRS